MSWDAPTKAAAIRSSAASPSGHSTSRPSAAKKTPKLDRRIAHGVLELGLRHAPQRTVQHHAHDRP